MAKKPAKTAAKPKLSIAAEREAKANELLVVATERRALDKREEAIKDWFKADCKGEPTVYAFEGAVVETTIDTRVSVDGKAVRDEHGEKYDKTSTFMKVVAREPTEEKTA